MNYLLKLLPETFRSSWCIAGGYAACPALAKDIDLWVYDRHDLAEARQTILDHLKAQLDAVQRYYQRPFAFEPEEATEQHQGDERYCNLFINISKVAVIYGRSVNREVKPVHIMVTDAPGPGELISAFDVSTHAVAIDHNNRVFKHGTYTHPGQAPALIRCNAKTQGRYEKICDRFGLPQAITDFTIDEPVRPVEDMVDDDIPF